MTPFEITYVSVLTFLATIGLGEFIVVEWRAWRLNRRDRRQGAKPRKESK